MDEVRLFTLFCVKATVTPGSRMTCVTCVHSALVCEDLYATVEIPIVIWMHICA
jgi:hypothetical protein